MVQRTFPPPGAHLDRVLSGNANFDTAGVSVTIPAVVPDRAVLLFSFNGGLGTAQRGLRGRLNGPTEIIFDRQTAGEWITVTWQVLSFRSGVWVQRGVGSMATDTQGVHVTLAPVNVGRTFALASAFIVNHANPDARAWLLRTQITGPTNMWVSRTFVDQMGSIDFAWQVVSFN